MGGRAGAGNAQDALPHDRALPVRHGDKRVALLRREHIEIMLAEISGRSAKRHWLKTTRALLQSAIPSMIKDNPADGIKSIKLPKSSGHHTWTDDEIAQYRAHWPLGTQQRSGDGVRARDDIASR